jgi:hypothetical protein
MASLLKLKTDIKKLKAAIASKATSGAIKTKLRGKLTTLENELDKLQPNKRKPKTTGPKSESALVRIAKKRRTNQGLSTSKSDIERDAIRPAKPAGRRTSANGNRYYEYRDNRVDTRQPPKKYRKLADGGDLGSDYRKKLENNIYKTALNKEVNGFKLVKLAWHNEGTLLWTNKQRPEIEIYATPFYTPDNDINFEEFINEEGRRREDKEFKLTGDIDKDTQYYFNYLESITKKYAKRKMADGGYMSRGGLTKQETLKVAEKYAQAIAKAENKNVSVNMDTLEEDSFDLDMGGIKFDGGSYSIFANGDVKNMALSGSPIYGKTTSSVDEILRNMWSGWQKMAKGGKTKDQEVVRGYFEDEAYEYADGGMVEKLRKEFSTKELDDNLMLDGYKTEVFDYTEEKEAKRWVKNNSKDNYVVPYENYDDNYIFVLVPKNKMADGGSVAKGNYEMLLSQAKEVMHHAEELMQVAKPDMDIEAWVVAKAERATTDLSDITHYLDGLKMAMGGMVKHNAHKVNA